MRVWLYNLWLALQLLIGRAQGLNLDHGLFAAAFQCRPALAAVAPPAHPPAPGRARPNPRARGLRCPRGRRASRAGAARRLCVAARETRLAIALATALPFPELDAFRRACASAGPSAAHGSAATLPAALPAARAAFDRPSLWAALVRGFARAGELDLSFAAW